MRTLELVIVVLSFVVSATGAFAADSALEVPYDLGGHKVAIDAAYNKEHPEQQGLQATVAALRARTAEVRSATNAAVAGSDQALTTSNQALEEAKAAKEAAQSAHMPTWVYVLLAILALGVAYAILRGEVANLRAKRTEENTSDDRDDLRRMAVHVGRIGKVVRYHPNPDDPVTDEEMERLALLFAPVATPDVALLTGPSSPLDDEDRWSGDDVPLDDPEEDDPVTDDSAEDWML